MNRKDYLNESLISKLASIRDRATIRDNNVTRNREALSSFLTDNGQTIETKDTIDELLNEYLGGCLVADSERSADMFRDNADLKEVNLDYYLGKHDRARGVISREYEDDEGENIHNHLLVEHIHDNPHFEGISRMATAYAKLTYVNQED